MYCSVGQFSTKLLHTHATKSTVNCFYDPLPFPKSVQPYTVVSILLLNCFPYCLYDFTNSFPLGKPSFYTRYNTHTEVLSGIFILIFKCEKYSIYNVPADGSKRVILLSPSLYTSIQWIQWINRINMFKSYVQNKIVSLFHS